MDILKQLASLRRRMMRLGLKPSRICRPYVGDEYAKARIKIMVINRFANDWNVARTGSYIDSIRWRKKRSVFWSFIETLAGRVLDESDPLPKIAWTNILKIAGSRGCTHRMIEMQREIAGKALVADLKKVNPDVIIMPTNDFLGGVVNQALQSFYAQVSNQWHEISPGTWHFTAKRKNGREVPIFITRLPNGWKKKYADLGKDAIVRTLAG
ncbi:MAG: hypothetical protein FWF01_04545 [Alphaproteobacteria bacterium]|nr:hypothetical protein [Alphaproteobacteria bacterium]